MDCHLPSGKHSSHKKVRDSGKNYSQEKELIGDQVTEERFRMADLFSDLFLH